MSSWDDLRLQVMPGAGLVARSAAALLVVPSVEQHQQPVLEQLVALTRNARPASGRALARKLAGIVASSEPEDVPDLAFFADLGSDNVAVLVLGEAEVSAETSAGPIQLSGRESLTWVDRVLPAPTRIVVGLPEQAQPVSMPHVDLVEGVVPGGGALLESRSAGSGDRGHAAGLAAAGGSSAGSAAGRAVADAPSARPTPVAASASGGPRTEALPATAGDPPFGDQVADQEDEQEDDVPPQRATDFQVAPILGEPEPSVAGEAAPESELVEGVYCKRGHFTDPNNPFCIVCGIELDENKIKRKGVRPALGYLEFDDGSVFHLDHDYVIGRQPEVDEEVRSGGVRGLRLDDSGGTVSRAHAIVRLVGWNVTLADRKSQNGTLVAVQDSDQFVPVSRDEPITLVPGTRIQLGQRILVYESERGAADRH